MKRLILLSLAVCCWIGAAPLFPQSSDSARRLESHQDRLDLKDIQIMDAQLESMRFQAALIQSQYAILTKEREARLADVMKRNRIDPAEFTVNLLSGEVEKKK